MTPCYSSVPCYKSWEERKVDLLVRGKGGRARRGQQVGSEGNQTQGYRVESRPRSNGRCKAKGLNADQKKQLSDGRPSKR